MDGQGTTWRGNIAENFNRLSRVHQRYRRQTDRRQTDGPPMTYSEYELEFTFVKNSDNLHSYLQTNIIAQMLTSIVALHTRRCACVRWQYVCCGGCRRAPGRCACPRLIEVDVIQYQGNGRVLDRIEVVARDPGYIVQTFKCRR